MDTDILLMLDSSSGRLVRSRSLTLKDYVTKELLERMATVAGSNEAILARIRNVETTQATSGEATARSLKLLESQMSGAAGSALKASVAIEAQTRAMANGFLEGKVTLKATAGHVVTGINITSATGAGEDISDITFDVANLKVSDGTTTGYPFQVVGGAVRVRNLVLVPADVSGLGDLATEDSVSYASITGTKPPTDADSTSGALIGGVNINSGGVTLSGTASIKSSSYSAGSAGWAIKADGSVEFNNGTYRGSIDIGTGTNKVSITSSGFTVGSGWGDGYSSNMGLRAGGFTLVNGGTVAMYTDFTGSTGSGLLVIGGTQIMGAGSGQITTGSITAGSIDIP